MNPTNGLTSSSNLLMEKIPEPLLKQMSPDLLNVVASIPGTLLEKIPSDLYPTILDYIDATWVLQGEEGGRDRRIIKLANGLNLRVTASRSKGS